MLDKLPFFFKFLNNNTNGGFPSTLPFHLYFDEELKMFRQRPTTELGVILNEVYKQGSLVEGSTSSESGKVYREKIINYILSKFSLKDSSTVLEVGFGSGIILKELKEQGAKNLFGIEPGNHTKVSGLEGIILIHDFFPSKKINKKFDLIYSLFVLEHIEDPIDYLQKLILNLNNDGKIILSVPNCEPYIKQGDISIFIHEHFSYFTPEAILKLVDKVNFNVEDISIIEGSLIVTICKTQTNILIKYEFFRSDNFYHDVQSYIDKLNLLFLKYEDQDLAIYAPIRALNLLYLTNKVGVRLIDDSTELHGCYLPVLTSPVESLKNVLSNPPKCIIIFSRTFGERVKARCLSESALKNTIVLTLNDLD